MTTMPRDDVAEAFAALPAEHRDTLLRLRALILDVADDVGAAPVRETLRWGQPSYLSARTADSTAVRLGSTSDGRHVALLFHCRSTVVRDFRDMFPNDFRYDGNRGILFRAGDALQEDKLRLCIGHALRYHAT